ncbi:hypothetical protein T4B_4496 [Trichinella pseudospiralis]|uniref:Uncharacterized protein n=2 Tax=Trichinella pseudospiralis TaxID=6337 RepID=A0A0V1JJZ3_TRIPS|nr:hypothetical protein T4D_1441 [Trichinella pseudospiralis]KRZ20181.1 hypothetical protein T4B_4496 [Trichinella pseudospiralis]KRZ35278.1 hypothetical protein T4C_7049 [Trichinella pseudospiralis]
MHWNERKISDSLAMELACNLEFLVAMKQGSLEKWGRGCRFWSTVQGAGLKGQQKFGLQSAVAPTVIVGSDEKRRLLNKNFFDQNLINSGRVVHLDQRSRNR